MPAQRLLWVIAGLALAVLPHLPHLSPWTFSFAAAAAILRIAIEVKRWPLPPRWLRIVAAAGALFGVLFTYRTLNGVAAGTALLVVMAGMKLLETRTVRDLTVIVFLSYFALFSAFLYNQELLRLPYMLLCAWLLTATLMRIHQSADDMPVREAVSLTGRMFLQALPLAVLLFLFFPRLPGQFWAMPARSHATTGLSEEMSPGDVSELSLSGEIAFRVHFAAAPPPPRERYWRGPVLHDFDGRAWRMTRSGFVAQPLEIDGEAYDYRITLQPHQRRWIFPLDVVTGWQGRGITRTADFQLLSRDPIATLSSFELRSGTRYRITGALPQVMRNMDTRLPRERNPRTIALAHSLRAGAASDMQFIEAVLALFRDQDYFYTLEPPRLAADAVDDLLFNTRRGFCEHFASAFTTLARAAGIPARVVTGYQGGEFNSLGGYLIVRQSDAHAWSEVWLEERGWVRVDPTAAIAPERIERGIDAALPAGEPVPGRMLRASPVLSQLRLAWDAVNTFWNNQIVEFGEQQQHWLLERLSIQQPRWEYLGAALLAILSGFFAILSVWLAWRFRPPARDPVAKLYDRLCALLARRQVTRQPHEGPNDYLARAQAALPRLADPLEEIRCLYVRLRYGPDPLESELSRLKFLIGRLKV
ncbi:hypothetical protein ACG33_04220 [Steroidobacter denitrificans]|uniref:Transglutaminase-like domain-containing protein n=2 Tax=Steroidobacter denitrificans TaxID=465721 RepID=A0A127F9P7_STEDE|nr:hypothetical protein ACG33_04220 [Steroidobacter denitrificans]